VDKCRGCFIISDCDAYIMDKRVEECPCRTCPVKIVCEDNTCEAYGVFIRSIYTDRQFLECMNRYNRPMKISEKNNILREAKNDTEI